MKKIFFYLPVILVFLSLACALRPDGVEIVDIKTAQGIDEHFIPLNITSIFPKDTEKVYCWFQWKSPRRSREIKVKWFYVSDDIHILEHTVNLAKKESAGGVSLNMPQNKPLPPGEYRVDLLFKNRVIKSASFKVQ